MTEVRPSYSIVQGILAAGPLILLLVALLRGWGATRAGGLALLVAAAVAIGPFGARIDTVVVSQEKGVVLSFSILAIIWAALLLYHLVAATGSLADIGTWLGHLAPSRPFLVLIVAWGFTSCLQGVAGYGVPVAIVAPLLVANGIAPAVAVISASIGHAWSVTFGSLGASYVALEGVSGVVSPALASDSAFVLGVLCIMCGAGAVWTLGGLSSLRMVVAPLAVAGVSMAAVQWIVAVAISPSLAAFAAGGAGLLILVLWGLLRNRQASARRSPVTTSRLLVALAPYAALLLIVLAAAFIEQVKGLLDSVLIRTPMPMTATDLGWTNPAEDSFRTISVLGNTGSMLMYASGLGYVAFRVAGIATRDTLGLALRRTARAALSPSLSVVLMIGMAMIMSDSGMTFALASVVAAAAGPAYPAIAAAIGAVGGFTTGSNTSSNVLLAGFQHDMAVLLGLPVTAVLAAQTAGGAIGSVVSPAKLIVGSSTVGLGGREGGVVRRVFQFGLLAVVLVGLWTVVAASTAPR